MEHERDLGATGFSIGLTDDAGSVLLRVRLERDRLLVLLLLLGIDAATGIQPPMREPPVMVMGIAVIL